MTADTRTPDTHSNINLPHAILAPVLFLSVAYLIYNALPVILGAAADSLALNEMQIGYLASIYMAGSAITHVGAVFWVRRLNWKVVISCGSLVAMCSYGISPLLGYHQLLFAFLMAGMANGAIVSCVLTCLGDTAKPDRNFGFGIGSQVLLAGAFAYLLPLLVTPRWGFTGVMFSLAATVGLTLLLIPLMPSKGVRGHQTGTGTADAPAELLPANSTASSTPYSTPTSTPSSIPKGSLAAVFLGVAGMLIYFTGETGVWTFLERIGIENGLSASQVGGIFGVTLTLSAGGAFLASTVGTRFGRVRPIAIATLTTGVALALLYTSNSAMAYAIGILLFAAAWNFVLPFQMTIITEGDTKGRFTPLIPACQLLGSSIGPAVAGNMIFDGDYSYVYLLAIISAAVSAVMFIAIETFLHARHTRKVQLATA